MNFKTIFSALDDVAKSGAVLDIPGTTISGTLKPTVLQSLSFLQKQITPGLTSFFHRWMLPETV